MFQVNNLFPEIKETLETKIFLMSAKLDPHFYKGIYSLLWCIFFCRTINVFGYGMLPQILLEVLFNIQYLFHVIFQK